MGSCKVTARRGAIAPKVATFGHSLILPLLMRHALLFVLLCAMDFATAQTIRFQHLTVEDGLPSLSINDIQQAPDGHIWLATDKGIACYDGYTFRTFTRRDGLTANAALRLYIDPSGRVWPTFARTDKRQRLLYLTDQGVQFISDRPLPLQSPTYQQMKDAAAVWIFDAENSYRYTDGGLEVLDTSGQNRYWGLTTVQGVPQLLHTARNAVGDSIASASSLRYWLTRCETAMAWGEAGWLVQLTDSIVYWEAGRVQRVDLNGLRNLYQQRPPYVLTREGAWSLSSEAPPERVYAHEGDFVVHRAFLDREGNWWLGTRNDGLYLLTAHARVAVTYGLRDGLDDPFVTALHLDANGTRYIGTANGDLYYQRLGDVRPQLFPLANARQIRAMADDGDFLYVGSEQGLHVLDLSNFGFSLFGFGISSDFAAMNCPLLPRVTLRRSGQNQFLRGALQGVNDLVRQGDALYIATQQGSWSMRVFRDSIRLERLDAAPSTCIATDGSEIWMGTESGIRRKAGDDFTTYLPEVAISDLVTGEAGEWWIGTAGQGVYAFGAGARAPVSLLGTSRDIVAQLHWADGVLWAATNNGVQRIVPDTLRGAVGRLSANGGKRRREDSPKGYRIRRYQVADGLPTREVNVVLTDGQHLYAGTNRGLTQWQRLALGRNRERPMLVLPGLRVQNELVPWRERYVLGYDENNLSIPYVGISYKSQGALVYRYRMSGIDADWQMTSLTELSYRGLGPGRYRFEVQAVDVDGRYSDLAVIQVRIAAPWWAQWWFRALVALAVIASVYVLVRYRVRAVQARAAEEQRIEQEKAALRLKIAEEKAEIERINNELARSRLETLQAQMNPHFAYNALTSIQKFILKQDNATANRYLVKFARLMRLFLESSKETFITLEKELELLRLYIEMEQLRFKDKFEVVYEIDRGIGLQQVPVPSMLLQIFVENAINHGLVYKQGQGRLRLAVEQEADAIVCIIEDDGIGRAAAQRIKAQSAGAYKGLGMQLSRERIAYLNRTQSTQIAVQIEDEIAEGGGGTRVRFEIVRGDKSLS